MDIKRNAGILLAILGLIFIIFPIFSIELVSIIVGLSLLFFGISSVFLGYNMRDQIHAIAIASIITGIIAIVLGFIFIFYIDALAFLASIEFYIVGIIMIVFGITALFSKITRFSTFTSLLVFIMGIVLIALAVTTFTQPIYIAMILGVVLIIEGISMILD